jgi:hypothetical protein
LTFRVSIASKVTQFFVGAALTEVTKAVQEAFPEVGSRSLPDIACMLVGMVGHVRRETGGRGYLDLLEVYAGGAAITRAAMTVLRWRPHSCSASTQMCSCFVVLCCVAVVCCDVLCDCGVQSRALFVGLCFTLAAVICWVCTLGFDLRCAFRSAQIILQKWTTQATVSYGF